ncbi:putative hexapeptide transferase family protein [Nitritalea halalkaliphila LW7]|uniref:Putative hexapeptide transferase family protein n=1 Tax=Nitritalea halalkaliphila LW7 TaxID=1189621 RepID=I5C5Z8_9BACT|nr:putative hexapeptide transferase family protein [Nitritalea halalkaliphila LW7]
MYRKRGVKKSWAKRFKGIQEKHPEYFHPVDAVLENEHAAYWKVLHKKPNLATLRLCKAISGKACREIVPEEIFVTDIEPTLNPDTRTSLLANKSFNAVWFGADLFPTDYFHKIEGLYYDATLTLISEEQFEQGMQQLSFPLIIKPNKDSFGGNGVQTITSALQLKQEAQRRKDFVLQEKIQQHPFFHKFNAHGINTLRVYVYRSVLTDEFHFLHAALRMGVGGSLDNETSGGIVVHIQEDGRLNGFAVDKYGTKVTQHPDTHHTFDEHIPSFDKLKEESLKVAKKIFFCRVIGLDAVLDKEGKWRFLEYNPLGHTIRFSQYAGQPFFGKFTDEVLTYCAQKHWTQQSV